MLINNKLKCYRMYIYFHSDIAINFTNNNIQNMTFWSRKTKTVFSCKIFSNILCFIKHLDFYASTPIWFRIATKPYCISYKRQSVKAKQRQSKHTCYSCCRKGNLTGRLNNGVRGTSGELKMFSEPRPVRKPTFPQLTRTYFRVQVWERKKMRKGGCTVWRFVCSPRQNGRHTLSLIA